jgi:triacylglycerol esterase/lipase EstA (alpha/beta hydrolase family)
MPTGRGLFARGVVAGLAGALIASGLYPVAPELALTLLRRARGRPSRENFGRRIAGEWALATAFQLARPLGYFGVAPGPQSGGPRPVLLLHGYTQSQSNFLVLARRLRRLGIGPLLGFDYWTLGRVESAARHLAQTIDALRDATGAEQVDLVGHSMGGVVGRAYVSLLGGAAAVANLVTLGSPHGGARSASLALGWPRIELGAGSRFLRALAAQPVPSGVRATAIWSRADCLVPSFAEAHVDGAEDVIFDDLGHMGLLVSRRVAAEVARRLTAASP